MKSVKMITPSRDGILHLMQTNGHDGYEYKPKKVFDPNEWDISRFQIGKPLSRGKFGHVLLVRERVTKFLFVLKMMFKSQLRK